MTLFFSRTTALPPDARVLSSPLPVAPIPAPSSEEEPLLPLAEMRQAWVPVIQAALQGEDLDLWRLARLLFDAWEAEHCATQGLRDAAAPALAGHFQDLVDTMDAALYALHLWQEIAGVLEELRAPASGLLAAPMVALLRVHSDGAQGRCRVLAAQAQSAFLQEVEQRPRLFTVQGLGGLA